MHDGKLDPNAGFDFIKRVRKNSKYVRVLMQSSDIGNREKVEKINAYFLDKNSPKLLQEYKYCIIHYIVYII